MVAAHAAHVSPAIYSLIGAVVGGCLTSGSNLLIERQRRKHTRDDRAKEATTEFKRALRLVLTELQEIDQSIRDAVGRGVVVPDKELPAFAWVEFKSVIAANLDEVVWSRVAEAYREENEINWFFRWRVRLVTARGWTLSAEEKDRYRTAWLAIRGAQQAIGPLLEDSPERAQGRVRAQQEVTAKVDRRLWPHFHPPESQGQ